MQFRRSCIAASVLFSLLAGFIALRPALAAPPVEITPADAADGFLKLKGKDVVDWHDQVMKYYASLSFPDQNKYADASASIYGSKKVFEKTNPEGALNAIITLVDFKALPTDAALRNQLVNPQPAIRYWAAKGLTQIMPNIVSVRGLTLTKAVEALNNALKSETNGAIKAQIIRAINAVGDPMELQKPLDTLKSDLQTNVPDAATLQAARMAIDSLNTLVAGGTTLTPAEQNALVTSAAHLASFACQQNVALINKKMLPEGNYDAALGVVKSALTLFNTLGKTNFAVTKPADPSDTELLNGQLLLDINSIVGSVGVGPGSLQKAFPTVPVPPAIGAPAATTNKAPK